MPHGDAEKSRPDAALVEVLQAHTARQPWWLGYLDTGVADVVQPEALRTSICVGWPYVLLQGGPQQALGWRANSAGTPQQQPALPGEQVVREVVRFSPSTLVVAQVAHGDRVGDLLDAGADAVVTRQVPPREVAQKMWELVSA